MTTAHPLNTLNPTEVWRYFYQLTQIPRPSHHEEAIQNFMMDFGRSLGLETFKDDADNIIIKKPASQGMEDRKGVILQSHLDMVPQANNDSTHNFATDAIVTEIIQASDETLGRTDDWVTAKGTTLGADNGIGVASIMAVLADNSLEHGKIEALFTSTEETGMFGAFGLQAGILDGDVLLNLDSEDEGELYVGCAGGVDVNGTLSVEREALSDNHQTYQVTLNGLKGGHSGLDIVHQHANANKLLARWLTQISTNFDIRVIQFKGGNLRNAIPREAQALIACDRTHLAEITQHLTVYQQQLNVEYQGIEVAENLQLSLTEYAISDAHANDNNNYPTTEPLTLTSQNHLLNLINASPSGVFRMSVSMDNLVETSCNLSIIDTTQDSDKVIIESLIRSSLASAKQQQMDEICALFALCDRATVEFSGDYPGWLPNMDSEILTLMEQTGTEIFGKKPSIKGIHAGLECGILGRHYPHWDMISFGPTIRGAHSPDERVNIQSVATFYQWLLLTLKQI